MNHNKNEVSKEEVQRIAFEYVSQNPSSDFTLSLISIDKSDRRSPCWSIVFEMRNRHGVVVDGPLVLGIDEYGEIVRVG